MRRATTTLRTRKVQDCMKRGVWGPEYVRVRGCRSSVCTGSVRGSQLVGRHRCTQAVPDADRHHAKQRDTGWPLHPFPSPLTRPRSLPRGTARFPHQPPTRAPPPRIHAPSPSPTPLRHSRVHVELCREGGRPSRQLHESRDDHLGVLEAQGKYSIHVNTYYSCNLFMSKWLGHDQYNS